MITTERLKLGMRYAFGTRVPGHGQPVAVHELSKAETTQLRGTGPAPG